MADKQLTIALAGNPNSGKTTIFNAITGSHQHVGNYPGVTVEKKEGQVSRDGVNLRIVDLPGTYSLTAHSIEEIVARNFILDEEPNVIVAIIDSSNMERNLYLATQLIELDMPLVLAFNMSDVAESRGFRIDVQSLSELLGVPIVQTVGHKKKGIDELLKAVLDVGQNPVQAVAKQRHPNYGGEIEPHVDQIQRLLEDRCTLDRHLRWFAIKLLEGDEETHKRVGNLCPESIGMLTDQADRLRSHVESICGDDAEIILADRRYGFISGACTETVVQTVEARHERSDRIDSVLTNRYLGLPIFAVLMYLVFHLTFTLGEPPMGWIEEGIGWMGERVENFWPADSNSTLRSLILDGIIAGVGGVIVFLPNILLLFLAIAILEDTGYMARAAFIMDRLMHKIGLHGKSFIPMLIGFGCSIPGIMATRTLETRRDRLTTMLVLPLMSCGARLPIYALIIPAFFPSAWRGPMLWVIYFIGILLAIVGAKLLRATLFRGQTTPFVMELPPYRMPTLRGVTIHMWERSWLYLKKAGTIILGVSIVLWAMTTFPKKIDLDRDYDTLIAQVENQQADPELAAEKVAELKNARQAEVLSYSTIGRIGKAIEPVIRPMGFDWKIGTATIGALAAKEVFVAQLGIVFSVGEADEESDSLREKLRARYTPLVGFCVMLFMLITAPCIATVAVVKREANSWAVALLQFAGLTVLAWVITTAVFQIGRLVT